MCRQGCDTDAFMILNSLLADVFWGQRFCHPLSQVRCQLREDAGLPRVITAGDNADEGHRKQWAAEIYGFMEYLQRHCRNENGLRLFDGDESRVINGFGVSALKGINRTMKLKTQPLSEPGTAVRERAEQAERALLEAAP